MNTGRVSFIRVLYLLFAGLNEIYLESVKNQFSLNSLKKGKANTRLSIQFLSKRGPKNVFAKSDLSFSIDGSNED